MSNAAPIDFETLLRGNGMGNGTSGDFRARFKGARFYVGEFGDSIGISTERGTVARLRSRQFYQ